MNRILILAALLSAAAGCGQKGPLYLPSASPPAGSMPAQPPQQPSPTEAAEPDVEEEQEEAGPDVEPEPAPGYK